MLPAGVVEYKVVVGEGQWQAQQSGGVLGYCAHRLVNSGDGEVVHPDDLGCHAQRLHPHQHARVRPAGAGNDHDPIHFRFLLRKLHSQFLHRRHVARRAQRHRSAGGDDGGLATAGLDLGGGCGHHIGARLAVRPAHLRAEQVIQQQVAGPGFTRLRLPGKHQHAAQPVARGSGGSLTAVVGLRAAGGDHGIRALLERIRDQEFELAGFVAAGGQAGLVIAFDQQARAVRQRGAQVGQVMDRRGQEGQRDARQVRG